MTGKTLLNQNSHNSLLQLLSLSITAILLLTSNSWADVESADVASGFFKHEFELGYRFIEDNGNTIRTREYDNLESSTTGTLDIAVVDDWGHMSLEGTYLNDKDFDAELHLETGPTFSFNIFTESLYHNLDHIDYSDTARPDAYEVTFPDLPSGSPTVEISDYDPTAAYGVQTQISEAHTRIKLGDYPAHLNLNYWSFERTGKRQLRYLEEYCSGCHLKSQTQEVNQIVEEFSASVDGHFGPIDVIAEQIFREFDNRAETPKDNFGRHFRQRTPGDYQHDDQPDVRYRATTLKAHTSLAGGVSLAGSGTYAKRENESDVEDVTPITAETELVKATGDASWIPSQTFTINTRYRYLDLEFDNADEVVSTGNYREDTIEVRDSINKTIHSASASVSYRPIPQWKIKAESAWQDIDRAVNDPSTGDEVWNVPEDETQVRYKLGLYGKSKNGRTYRMRSWIQLKDSSDPAYGASFDTRQTAFLGLDFTPSQTFGLGINGKYELSEQNDYKTVFDEGETSELRFDRDREQDSISATTMAWVRPTDTMELGLHYGYLQTRVKQDVIFGTDTHGGVIPDFIIPATDAEYDQTVHSTSLQLTWRPVPNWSTRLEGRLIQSESEFDPTFADEVIGYDSGAFTAAVSDQGLREISRVDILQTGATAGLTWEPGNSLRYALTYTFDRYDDRRSEDLDGTVQTYMASVAKSW